MTPVTETLYTPGARPVTCDQARLLFVPRLFATPFGESMAMNFLSLHSNYDGGAWDFYEIAVPTLCEDAGAVSFTGYIAPGGTQRYQLTVPGNYFDAEISADAAGIIATLFVLNQLSWMASERGAQYARTCRALVGRQDALKDFISQTRHPERHLIYRAID